MVNQYDEKIEVCLSHNCLSDTMISNALWRFHLFFANLPGIKPDTILYDVTFKRLNYVAPTRGWYVSQLCNFKTTNCVLSLNRFLMNYNNKL